MLSSVFLGPDWFAYLRLICTKNTIQVRLLLRFVAAPFWFCQILRQGGPRDIRRRAQGLQFRSIR